jgi:hypothetical protein
VNGGLPQTALEKFFTPFDAVATIDDIDASSDALFQGQNWQNLAFAFEGLTGPHVLTLPSMPFVGMQCTLLDGDGTASGTRTLSFKSASANVCIPGQAAGTTVVGVAVPFGSVTVEWTGLAWSYVSGAAAGGASGSSYIALHVQSPGTVQALVGSLTFADPGGGTGTGCAVVVPQNAPDGGVFGVTDTTATANATTRRIAIETLGVLTEDPSSGSGTFSTGTVYIVQPSDTRWWAWDDVNEHFKLV